MQRTIRLMQWLVLVTLTACAPVVYETTYHDSNRPQRYVAADYRTSSVRSYRQPQIPPIEVTLYGDHLSLGWAFKPIVLVIADNQFVAVPVRDRYGRAGRLYAHYHMRNLHFDLDRTCRAGHGMSNFAYDRRWDTGRDYHNLSAGKDYDIRGLKVKIKNYPPGLAKAAGQGHGNRQVNEAKQEAKPASRAHDAQHKGHRDAADQPQSHDRVERGDDNQARAATPSARGQAAERANSRATSSARAFSGGPERSGGEGGRAQGVSQLQESVRAAFQGRSAVSTSVQAQNQAQNQSQGQGQAQGQGQDKIKDKVKIKDKDKSKDQVKDQGEAQRPGKGESKGQATAALDAVRRKLAQKAIGDQEPEQRPATVALLEEPQDGSAASGEQDLPARGRRGDDR